MVRIATNSVSLVREMHAKLAEQGVALLDAPVSGGPRGANSGKLAIWVGGDEAVFQKHKAVLDAMGDRRGTSVRSAPVRLPSWCTICRVRR